MHDKCIRVNGSKLKGTLIVCKWWTTAVQGHWSECKVKSLTFNEAVHEEYSKQQKLIIDTWKMHKSE